MLGYTISILSGVTDRVNQIWQMCHSFMRRHLVETTVLPGLERRL
jgi:hypothetical protein